MREPPAPGVEAETSCTPRPAGARGRGRWWLALPLGLVLLAVVGGRWRQNRLVEVDAAEARRLVAAGKVLEAQPYFGRWLQARPDDGEAYLLTAQAAFALGQVQVGLQALERAQALGFDRARVDRERGLALAAIGRAGEALPLLLAARDRANPADPIVLRAIAQAYLATFQMKAAREAVDAWIASEPRNPDAYLARVEVGRRTNASTEVLIADLEQAVALAPQNATARQSLAEARLTTGNYGEAESLYRALSSAGSPSYEVLLGLGLAQERLGEDDKALENLASASGLPTADARALVALGRIEARRGHLEPALRFLDQAIALDPHDVEARHQRAGVLNRQGRTAEAIADRDEAVRLRADQDKLSQLMIALLEAPRDLQFRLDAARWLFDHGHPAEAIRWTDLILRDEPAHAPTHQLLADYYEKAGQTGLANYHRLQQGRSRPGDRP